MVEHAVASCGVAKAFWRLVHRAALGLRVVQYYTRNTCPQDAFGRLCVVVGEFVSWRNRCKVVAQDRRFRLRWPLLRHFRQELRSVLSGQLFWLGEAEFLHRWSCNYLDVADGRVQIKMNFPDVLAGGLGFRTGPPWLTP